jgi:uncharacterized membrane protein
MSGRVIPIGTSVPWPLRGPGRFAAALVAATIGALATAGLPTETRVIASFVLFAATFVVLVYVLMSTATPEQCAYLSQMRLPGTPSVLVVVVAASALSVGAIGAMLHSQADKVRWLRSVHLIGSLAALFLTWIMVQILFGFEYMRLYYRDWRGGSEPPPNTHLAFPDRAMPDLWDFMYYSFTIAMCYQTSDVTISGVPTRRLTLVHAIYSFLFVAIIIGFVVNVLSNAT